MVSCLIRMTITTTRRLSRHTCRHPVHAGWLYNDGKRTFSLILNTECL
jgi:hypothetical protein